MAVNRSLVTLRAAEPTDAPALADLWAESMRRADHREHVADLELMVKNVDESFEERLIVAEHDGQVAGAVLLRVSTVSPINLESAVHALAPHVFPQFRRHGIGRLLMECAVSYAEEIGVTHVVTAVTSGSRDANRFMARLGLGPQATYRLAPTAAVRARLTAQRPAMATTGGGRQLSRVLAARRSIRRSQSRVT